MGRNCEKYGKYYFCVKTDLSENGDIYLFADDAIVENGDLFFINSESSTNMCFARGSWKTFYAASCIDGGPVAVEHWKGEIPE